MFTFGREKEIQVAIHRHGEDEGAQLIIKVVNAVHDMLEGKMEVKDVSCLVKKALSDGRRDVWDAAGNWLLKLNKYYPSTTGVWSELTNDSRSEVRFRVACHLDHIPDLTAREIYDKLIVDSSKRVRVQADAKWDFRKDPSKYA